MKSAPGLRGLYPHPERQDFTPLSVRAEKEKSPTDTDCKKKTGQA